MDLYTVFKFLHVVTAIAWVGGGITMFALALMALARGDEDMASQAVKHVAFLGTRWFVPASILTLVFGLIMTFLGGLWGEAWIILGLAGFASTFFTGLLGLKPLSEQIEMLHIAGAHDEARPLEARIMQLSKFDYTVMAVVIADMVFRPAWNDLITLSLMAIVVAGGAVLFLGSGFRRAVDA
ncbi:DUF2269 family protein [Devosia sp. ZB163]|uniref:DUF2269 family protein n=1 Tax=Devosia sp. ZB163 TaxID=3025938 RepID=UPI0023628FEB|nr:DUF2269 family protein [Devosia sp. ZB163]MDC9824161.1 DUF2269 family protein [Devosia sp. ZB163]